MLLAFFIMMVFAAGMLTAAINDAATMKIPNWASLLILAGFIIVVPFVWGNWSAQGSAWLTLGEHVSVGVTVFVVSFIIFAVGALGAGDAKLMAATAFWWQWPDLMLYLIYTTMAGGVIALFILFGRNFVPARALSMPWLQRLIKDEKQMPYGLALAFGALVTLPQSAIFKAAVGLG